MVKLDSEEPRSLLFVGICLGYCHVPVESATRTRVLPSMAPESSPACRTRRALARGEPSHLKGCFPLPRIPCRYRTAAASLDCGVPGSSMEAREEQDCRPYVCRGDCRHGIEPGRRGM
jgi:hypothetical protein